MVGQLKFFWQIIKKTFKEWNDSSANKDSMSLAYSAIFSIPGVLIIIIWIAGNIFGEEAIRGELTRQIGDVMGEDVSKSLENIIAATLVDKQNWLMKVVGVASLVFGATTLFFQLQRTLNDLWNVEAIPEKAIIRFLLNRFNSLLMILIIGLLVMSTMLLSSLLSFFNNIISSWFGTQTYSFLQVANYMVGFLVMMVIFALTYKILPDAKIRWRSIWAGAFITTILFTFGKFLLGLYFAQVKPASAFGAAGTVILIMMWVNYSCMILFFGAIFTKVYTEAKGFAIKPAEHAQFIAVKNLNQN